MWYPPCLSILLACCHRLCAVGGGRERCWLCSSRSRAVRRFASRPCLLDVCRRMPRRFAPVISSLSCLTACRLPLRSSARASSRSVIDVVPSYGVSLPAPSHRHDGRGDTTVL